jgi:hypothetical protein
MNSAFEVAGVQFINAAGGRGVMLLDEPSVRSVSLIVKTRRSQPKCCISS